MIRVIIIEDIQDHRELLKEYLEDYDDVTVVGEFVNAKKGLAGIREHQPDLIFLDVEMPPGMNGLEMLEQIPTNERDFGLIFTTMHEKYARRAIDMACLDYLDKPIVPEKLAEALRRFRESDKESLTKRNSILGKENMLAIANIQKGKRYETIVDARNIIYCKADGNYTEFYLKDGRFLSASKGIAHYTKLLESYGMLKVHRSYLINLNHVDSIAQDEVIMRMDAHPESVKRSVSVSRTYSQILQARLLR